MSEILDIYLQSPFNFENAIGPIWPIKKQNQALLLPNEGNQIRLEIFGMTLQHRVCKCTHNWWFFYSFEDTEKEILVQKEEKVKKIARTPFHAAKLLSPKLILGLRTWKVKVSHSFHRKSIEHREPLSSDLTLITIPSLMTMKA